MATLPSLSRKQTTEATSATSESADQAALSEPVKLKPEEKAKIVSWVNDSFRTAKNSRSKQERQWYVNLAFHQGRQYVQTILAPGNQGGTRLQTPKAPYWRARPVINKIRGIIRKELAKLCSTKPTAHVIPASSEDSDLFAAQAAEALWEAVYDEKKVQKTIRRSQFWARITGTGFIKCYWDDNALDLYNNQKGDICIESVTPFHVFVPDLTEEEIENQPWVMHVSLKSVEWAQMAFGAMVDEPITATSKSESVIDTGFLNLINADMSQDDLDTVEVIEVWIKPRQVKKYPLGAVITVVGGQLAQFYEMWPYANPRFPFIKFDNIDSGGFYSESVITDLLGLQKEYNRSHGQIIEAKNRMAKPQLLAQKGSIDPGKITTEPGLIILYKMGYQAPTPLPLVSLPAYVMEEIDRIQGDIDDISSQHEVSKGSTPAGVTAATAISYLQEQDDTVLSSSVESMEFGMEKLASLTLSYVEQYWTTSRQVKTVGTDGSFDVIMLKGADISGNTDIRIEKDSALPQSRAAKQAFIMDLMKMGFIDPNKGLEVMEIGGVSKLYEAIHVDVRQAQRENLRMQNVPEETITQFVDSQSMFNEAVKMNGGQPPPNPDDPTGMTPMEPPPPPVPVNSWDNHQAHIEIHNKFRKSQTFEAMPDNIKQVFEAHVQMHMFASQGGNPAELMPGQEPGQMPPPDANMQPPEQGMPPMPNGAMPSQEGMM